MLYSLSCRRIFTSLLVLVFLFACAVPLLLAQEPVSDTKPYCQAKEDEKGEDGEKKKDEEDKEKQPEPRRRRWQRKPRVPKDVKLEQDVEYGKGGKVSLKLDIVQPKEKPEKPMPVLVFIHGGGWRGGDKASGIQKLVPYAQRGYFCATINYRLTHLATFPAQIEDCKCAIRFLRSKAKEYNLDSDHIGVWGSSAGGHLVALLGTSGGVKELEGKGGHEKFSSKVQAVCDWFGPTDFLKIAAEAKPKPGKRIKPVELLLGGPVSENEEKAKQASPVTHVDKDDPPFLIMHGTRDPLVPLSQSKILHEKLEKAGVESELVVLEGAGHGGRQFMSEENTKKISEFFDKRLKKDEEKQEEEKEEKTLEKDKAEEEKQEKKEPAPLEPPSGK